MIRTLLDIKINSIRKIITALIGDYLQDFMIDKKNKLDYLKDIKSSDNASLFLIKNEIEIYQSRFNF